MNHVVINEQVPSAAELFDATTKSLSGLPSLLTHTLGPIKTAKVAAKGASGGGLQRAAIRWRGGGANEGVQEPSWLQSGEEVLLMIASTRPNDRPTREQEVLRGEGRGVRGRVRPRRGNRKREELE